MPRLLTPARINQLAADPRHQGCMRLHVPVDPHKPWIPEEYTALFYTPLYAALTHAQRLRYNQLFALRSNEYIMMLEHELIDRLLPPLKRVPQVRDDVALCLAIDTMQAEERRHFEGFAALNRHAHPALYPPGQDRFFSRLPWHTRVAFGAVGLLSGRFVFALWFLMAMEESSKTMASRMQSHPETATLGPLDPAFAHVHHQHLKDETRHIHLDAWLVQHCLHRSQPQINAWLFKRMLPAVTTPTRGGSGAQVIRQWLRECPELAPRASEFMAAQLALRHDRRFQASLFNRSIMPQTFALFDQCAALAQLSTVMPGYQRPR